MFYDRFKQLCDSRGISCNKAALEIGLSNATPTKWKKTGATPVGETLDRIAKYFGVSTDYLLGKETEKAPAEVGKRSLSDDDMKFALWGDCEDMDDEDLADVRRYAAFIRERKKDKK